MKLDSQFNIKIQGDDRRLVVAAASKRDQSPAEFARDVLVSIARATLLEQTAVSRESKQL